jgi:superfamily I DNA/RNA helicase
MIVLPAQDPSPKRLFGGGNMISVRTEAD